MKPWRRVCEIRQRGKFSLDKMSSKRKLSKMSGKEIQLSVCILKMSCKSCLFRPIYNVQRNLKMFSEGPVVRWSKCPAKLKIISRTMHAKIGFSPKHPIKSFESRVFAMGQSSYTKHEYFFFLKHVVDKKNRSRDLSHIWSIANACLGRWSLNHPVSL